MVKGLKYPVCALYSDATGSPIYTSGIVMGKTLNVNVQWNKNSAEMYADDDLEYAENNITGGTETIGLNQLTDQTRAFLFGHTYANGSVTASVNDEPPYVGHGFYAPVVINRVNKFRVIWLYKVKFGESNDDIKTKENNSSAFQTPTIDGKVFKSCTGLFYEIKTFDTEAEAITYLNNKAGITVQLEKPTASKASGSYTGTQSITLSALSGADIWYTLNGTTPSPTNGTKYSAAISVSATCALRAIAVKSGMGNSEVVSYEYIIS